MHSLIRLTRSLSGMSNTQPALSNITTASSCVACEGIGSILTPEQVRQQRDLLLPTWSTNEDSTRLLRTMKFKNFAKALEYVNRVGQIAEAEQHHPDITIRSYRFVDVSLWTHTLNGVTDNDLIMAVKIDTIPTNSS